MFIFFFFKQKTAYEMRISDWSSDVCSSDLVKVSACAVCRTDLHVVDGDLPNPVLPVIPGHEIVGRIDALGEGVEGLQLGERVGIPWLGHSCGACSYCAAGRENLRSEEHTSELQSLMRISYAVFCLKKTKNT